MTKNVMTTTGCPAILCANFLNLTWLFYSIFVNFFSQHTIPPIQENKNERSISSDSAKGAEIFDFSFWSGILKKYTFNEKNYFGNCCVYVLFFKFTSFLHCFKLFLSDWNLHQIQNVSREYGI